MNLNNLINQSRFSEYAAYLKSQNLSDSSIRRKLSSLSSFQKFLVKKKIIDNVVIAPPVITRSQVQKTTWQSFFKSFQISFPTSINDLRTNPSSKYIVASTLLIIFSALGYGLYYQTILKARRNLAYSTAALPVTPGRFLSFQGRLTDSSGNPITSSTSIVFKLYDTAPVGTGTSLYNSAIGNSQTVTPDENGIFSVTIGKSHGTAIPSTVFSENANVYLEITSGGEIMDPRQQIATVGYALNSETLQGLPPSASGIKNTVLVLDASGNINLGETSPSIISTSGTFGLQGQAVLIKAADGSGGNITINPDGAGKLLLITEGAGTTAAGGLIEATNANIASGNLISLLIRNDNRGYNFIDLANYNVGTTTLASRFSVSAAGDVNISNNLSVGGSVTLTNLPVGTGTTVVYINSAGVLTKGILSVGTTYTFTNGLSNSSNTIGLGGTLTQLTKIDFNGFNFGLFGNGNFGLGTTSPTYKLDIVGSNSLLRIGDTAGNTLVDITEANAQFNLPAIFNSSGNVSLANDLLFSNATASTIHSASPLYIEAGEAYASSDLTLRTFNYGNVIVDSSNLSVGGSMTLTSIPVGTGTTILYIDASGKVTQGLVGVGTTYTFTNGITNSAGNVGLGGTITQNTRLNIGNTEVMYFQQSSGYVGIGSTNPLYPFQVSGNTNLIGKLFVGGGGSTPISAAVNIQSGADQVVSQLIKMRPSQTGDAFQIQSSSGINGDLFTINSSGSVGIGLTSPLSKFHVVGTGTSNLAIFDGTGNIGINTTAPSGKLEIVKNTVTLTQETSYAFRITDGSDNTGLLLGVGNSSNVGIIQTLDPFNSWTTRNLSLQPNGGNVGVGTTNPRGPLQVDIGDTRGFFVAANGNIGMGTTNPIYKLDVTGVANISTRLGIGGTNNVYALNVGASGFITNFSSTKLSVGTTAFVGVYALNVGGTAGFGGLHATGRVGIGVSTPAYALDVLVSSAASYIMQIKNVGNTATTGTGKGLLINLGNGTSRNTGNYYIAFAGGNGTVGGKIQSTGNTSVAFTAGGTDYAEWFKILNGDPKTSPGYVIQVGPNNSSTVATTGTPIGVISDNPTVIGGDSSNCSIDDDGTCQQNFNNSHNLVGLLGQINTYVSTENGPINIGDALMVSSTPGVAAKAIKSGHTIGYALESYSGSDIARVNVYVNPSWYDPELELTSTGEVNVNYNISDSVLASLGYDGSKNEIQNATYSLTDSFGRPVTKMAQFAQISASKITAGLINTTNLVTKNILAEVTKSKVVKTDTITPLDDVTDTIAVDGNLDIAGTLTAIDASFSTVYANNVVSKDGNLTDVMAQKIADLRSEIQNSIASIGVTSAPATPSALVAEATSWSYNTAANQVEVGTNMSLTSNLVVGAKLAVLGDTQLANAFITGTFTAGEVAIKENFIETTATALFIQPSGMGSVNIMNNTLVIADNGEVTVNGNLAVNGKITASEATVSGSLFGNLIAASEIKAEKITADSFNVATASATPIIAESGFALLATSSAQLATNATAGTATLPAGKTEIILYNSKLNANSIVYLTPVGSTNNQVVYLKSKFISPTPTQVVPTAVIASDSAAISSNFVIALDSPLTKDVNINWWIIN